MIRRRLRAAVLAGVLAFGAVMATPKPVQASCMWQITPDIWQLPPELIAWYLYWSAPWLLDYAAEHGVTTIDELMMWLVNIPFCY